MYFNNISYIYDPKFYENPRVKPKTTCSPWTQLRQEAARDLSAHGAPGRAELVGDWDDILLHLDIWPDEIWWMYGLLYNVWYCFWVIYGLLMYRIGIHQP